MSSDTSPSEEGGYPTAPDGVSGGGAQIKKRRLMKHDSGSAAVGILMTLSPKHAIDTAVGPFLGKGLPTGLGLAVGSAAGCRVSELIKIDRKKLTKFDQIQLMKYSHYIIDPCLLK